jgi:hypothetical protein
VAEQRHNGDGSFVRERMGALLDQRSGPLVRPGDRSRVLYYRAEADPPFYLLLAHLVREAAQRAGRQALSGHATAGTASHTRDLDAPEAEPGTGALLGTFEEPDAGLVLRRDPDRFVSWSWNAHPDVAQGLFIPRDGDHLAEWNGNLAPSFVVLDAPLGRTVAWRRTVTFDGGFATLGVVRCAGGALEQRVLFAALPDGRSAIYAYDARACWDLTLLHQEGLRLNLGNDLFNGYRRHLRFAGADGQGGAAQLVAGEAADSRLAENASTWLEVDELLGVQFLDDAGDRWTIRTFPQRNATDMSAWYAILCRPFRSGARVLPAGAIVQQTCARLVANPAAGWRSDATCTWAHGAAPAVVVHVAGLDGHRYRVDADWARRTVDVAPQQE